MFSNFLSPGCSATSLIIPLQKFQNLSRNMRYSNARASVLASSASWKSTSTASTECTTLHTYVRCREWIATISSWPPNFEYRSMAEVGRNLSARLRVEEKCDFIIALTHSR
jgi:hypothetical protein